MIIAEESILRRIPSIINHRQRLFIEGIRFSVEMADLAHRRLRDTLPLLTFMQASNPENPSTVSAILDAWSIVDSLHRLRGLIEGMPGLKGKKKSPKARLLLEATANVPALRNTVQHLGTEIHGIVDDRNWTVFGTLSWGIVEPEKNQITASTFLPGAPRQGGVHSIINPMNRQIWHLPVDSITLERSGISVCLSDAMRRVQAWTASLEENLAKAFAEQIPPEGQGRHPGADLILNIVMGVRTDQIVAEGTPDPEPSVDESDDEDDTEGIASVP